MYETWVNFMFRLGGPHIHDISLGIDKYSKALRTIIIKHKPHTFLVPSILAYSFILLKNTFNLSQKEKGFILTYSCINVRMLCSSVSSSLTLFLHSHPPSLSSPSCHGPPQPRILWLSLFVPVSLPWDFFLFSCGPLSTFKSPHMHIHRALSIAYGY